MARLIDADKLIQILEEEFVWTKQGWEDMINTINNQPTAYGVDAVIEKLEAKKIHRFHEDSGRSNYKSLAQGYIIAIQDAIDIVKRGGADDV